MAALLKNLRDRSTLGIKMDWEYVRGIKIQSEYRTLKKSATNKYPGKRTRRFMSSQDWNAPIIPGPQ